MSDEPLHSDLLSFGPDDGDWPNVVRRAASAHRRNQVCLGIALLALVVAAAACAHAVGIVPWSSKKPHLAPAHPRLAPACSADDIRASVFFQAGTGGAAVGDITLTNIASSPCSLLGWPRLILLSRDGNEERVQLAHVRNSAPPDPLLDPRGSLRSLQPRKRVSVGVQWMNECDPAATLALRLAGSSLLRIPSNGPPRCLDKSAPVGLAVSPFNPASPAKGTSVKLPLSVRILARYDTMVGNGIPAISVRRGSIIHFQISLKNISKHPFRFGRCPDYEELGPPTTQAPRKLTQYAYVLNCRKVGTMVPGATVTFAMQFRFPADARLGDETMGWYLAPFSGASAPYADARLKVVR